MTYLEAAAAVLKEAGQSLHFAEITRRALEKKLLEPKGKPCLRTGVLFTAGHPVGAKAANAASSVIT